MANSYESYANMHALITVRHATREACTAPASVDAQADSSHWIHNTANLGFGEPAPHLARCATTLTRSQNGAVSTGTLLRPHSVTHSKEAGAHFALFVPWRAGYKVCTGLASFAVTIPRSQNAVRTAKATRRRRIAHV